ncbi:MAG: hypothetical protein QM765_27390 [Myxococcales bacterium]
MLFKLVWYRKGGAASASQWRDVVGVLRVSAGELEHAYLVRRAARLGVDELLAKAQAEAAAPRPSGS